MFPRTQPLRLPVCLLSLVTASLDFEMADETRLLDAGAMYLFAHDFRKTIAPIFFTMLIEFIDFGGGIASNKVHFRFVFPTISDAMQTNL